MPSSSPESNLILSASGGLETHLLSMKGTIVRFRPGTTVYDVGDRISYVYFLRNGVASLASADDEGALVEVAMVGCEGVLGGLVVLNLEKSPFRVTIPAGGAALRVRRESLLEVFHNSLSLRTELTRYLGFLFFQVNRSAVCNCAHALDARLARWLSICYQHLQSELPLTQETLAEMLGVTRTAVTLAASKLSAEKIIRQERGKITILKPLELERCSCTCYTAFRQEYERLVTRS